MDLKTLIYIKLKQKYNFVWRSSQYMAIEDLYCIVNVSNTTIRNFSRMFYDVISSCNGLHGGVH